MSAMATIKHLIPAPDWFAVFEDYMEDGVPSALTFVPLVGWGVFTDEKDGEDDVLPLLYHMDGGVEPATGENLRGIVHATQRENVKDWIKKKKE